MAGTKTQTKPPAKDRSAMRERLKKEREVRAERKQLAQQHADTWASKACATKG